jgi:hypothetical protein
MKMCPKCMGTGFCIAGGCDEGFNQDGSKCKTCKGGGFCPQCHAIGEIKDAADLARDRRELEQRIRDEEEEERQERKRKK